MITLFFVVGVVLGAMIGVALSRFIDNSDI